MQFYDIFNGDADGICALQQLRLEEPRAATLVTGVKRDVRLLDRVTASAGDELTVLDVSLKSNAGGVMRLLGAGARLRYFDHHAPGEIPRHANLKAFIDTAPDTCTSLIVDRYLNGRQRLWAVVAAFGDNLAGPAQRAGAEELCRRVERGGEPQQHDHESNVGRHSFLEQAVAHGVQLRTQCPGRRQQRRSHRADQRAQAVGEKIHV